MTKFLEKKFLNKKLEKKHKMKTENFGKNSEKLQQI